MYSWGPGSASPRFSGVFSDGTESSVNLSSHSSHAACRIFEQSTLVKSEYYRGLNIYQYVMLASS